VRFATGRLVILKLELRLELGGARLGFGIAGSSGIEIRVEVWDFDSADSDARGPSGSGWASELVVDGLVDSGYICMYFCSGNLFIVRAVFCVCPQIEGSFGLTREIESLVLRRCAFVLCAVGVKYQAIV
jgi:hypothetical protein